MAKKLEINCGTGLLLNYRPEVLEPYDTVEINAGSLVLSAAVNAALAEKQAQINAGSTRVLTVTGRMLDLGENARIAGGEDFAGCYLVAEGSLLLAAEGAAALAGAEGLYVGDVLYHPASVAPRAVGGVVAGKTLAYPDGAVVELEDITLTAARVQGYADGAVVWTPGTVEALEEEPLRRAAEKGLHFAAAKLKLAQNLQQPYGELFTVGATRLIPEGYVLTGDLTLNRMSLAQYDEGARLYVQGDLLVQQRDAACLQKLAGLVVEGRALLPVESVQTFRKLGTAGEIFAYEGELWQVNGREEISHAMLQTATDGGVSYTLVVNGALEFAQDVAPKDLEVINAIHYNGIVSSAAALRPLLMARVVEGNGMLLDAEQMNRKKEDTNKNDATSINMGVYKML